MVFRLLFLSFAFLIPVIIHSQEDARVTLVRIEGNRTFSDSRLMELISLKPTHRLSNLIFKKRVNYFTAEKFDSDGQNIAYFYMNEGFPDVEVISDSVIFSPNGRKATLLFTIKEGEPYFFNRVSIKNSLDSSLTGKVMSNRKVLVGQRFMVTKGARFREESVRNDHLLLGKLVSSLGYPYAEITPVVSPDTVARTADIGWDIALGSMAYFGNTIIEGDTSVSRHHITRQLCYGYGSRWSQSKLEQSQRYIYSLGVYRVVTVKAVTGTLQPDTIPVSVYLKEAPRMNSRIGIGYGREDRLRIFGELQLLRFPGGVSRMSLSARHSYLEPVNVSLKFYQPAFPFRYSHLLVNPYFVMQNEPAFELKRYGGEIGLMLQAGRNWSGNMTLYSENIRLTVVNSDSLYDMRSRKSVYSKSGLSAGTLYSTLLPALDPEEGIAVTTGVKWNGLLRESRYPFVRLTAKVVYYHRVNGRMIIASRAEAGTVAAVAGGDFIPVEERFYGGGYQSLRGWNRYRLGPVNGEGKPVGGLSSMTLSVEPRIRLSDSFVLAIFADGGNVWRSSKSFNPGDLRYSAGAGIRFRTPIGPVGVDVARPVFDKETKWKLHFNIGNPF